MDFLIGTDEAGYGPNLGPLTIAATLWEVDRRDTDLYECLNHVVSRRQQDNKLTIADSKTLYSPAGSIGLMETSVLAVLYAVHDRVPASCLSAVDAVP